MNSKDINQQFYTNIFKIWNNDPNYFWDGFWYLYPNLDQLFSGKDKVKVLDIGSANGRFFNFLEFCFPEITFEKIGIDFVDFPPVNEFKFIKMDISEPEFLDIDLGEFDLITMFGVYHHIQYAAIRDRITSKVCKTLKPDGLFVFTRWNFLLLNRLRKHIIGPLELKEKSIDLNLTKLELGDYYLKWDKGEYSIRFANYMDIAVIDNMLTQANLKCILSFKADDKSENRNSYFVCKKN